MKRQVRPFLTTMVILCTLWITAHAQPVQITEIPPNSTNFKTIGDLVYFMVDDQLWRTDGTAQGTFFLRDGIDSRSVPYFTEFGKMLFFLVGKDPGAGVLAWKELWRTDGTPAGTILLKSSSGYNVEISDKTSQYVFFGASEPGTGYELYRTNGTTAGTSLVRDINPGTASGYHGSAAVVGNELFFGGDDGVHGTELWKSNGTSSGTTIVKDIFSGSGSGFVSVSYSFPADESFFGSTSKFFFTGYTPTSGNEPWTSDGTAAGTVMLRDVTAGSEGTAYIFFKIEHNGNVYFITKPPFERWESEESTADLWKTQGSPASTVKVTEVGYASDEFNEPFRILGNKILFFSLAASPNTGPHYLWASDGTSGGTEVIFSMQDYAAAPGPLPFEDIVNDHLLFYGIHDGTPLPFFRSDGTDGGTEIFTRFASGAYLKYPRDVTKVGDLVFYGDHDGPADNGYAENPQDHFQLIQSDGFTTQSVRDIEGGSYSGTFDIVDYNGKVVFTTYDENAQPSPTIKKLWIYDPTSQPAEYFTLVDADTDQDIRRLHEGDTITKSADNNINITYTPEESVGSVVFKLNDVTTRTETAAPYSLAGDVNGDYAPWQGAQPGTYELTATPYSEAGGNGTPGDPLTINFTIQGDEPPPSGCTASGTILREQWNNVSGNNVSAIPVNNQPSSTSQLNIFEGPTNSQTNFGARIRGYICPPATGNYTFWIASNDHSELWLSTDDSPTNRRRIAYVTGATNPRQWDKFPTQKSTAIMLTAGKRYYIEALHKQGVGSQNIAVGWQLPNGTLERPIPGMRLSPFSDGVNQEPVVTITRPGEGETFTTPASVTIEATATDEDGSISKVEFFEGPDKLGEDVTSPYSFTWQNVPAGNHNLSVKATDSDGATAFDYVSITVKEGAGECTASGTITRDYWANVSGNRVSDIPVNSPPTSSGEITIFEGPSNIGSNYATRIRGYICPPATGNYTFWISSNDHSELWLSTDDDPANRRRIAYITGATGIREWTKFPTQQSAQITLTQGQRYYIEALHKQGVGSDNIAVGWRLPSGNLERPIPGNRLSPFGMDAARMASQDDSNASKEKALFSQISIYPNPAQSTDRELTIAGYEGIDKTIETQVDIVNLTGDVVFSDRISCGGDCSSYLMKINEQLVPGMYLVNLKTNGVRSSKRLLVK
jgi:ELWxxDGT repeat protein